MFPGKTGPENNFVKTTHIEKLSLTYQTIKFTSFKTIFFAYKSNLK